jgi:16S rRNA (guanine527-N7)-methyltransferase
MSDRTMGITDGATGAINEKLRILLSEGAASFGAILDDSKIGLFFRYMDLLKEWNTKINLTAIEDDESIVIKHFTDSLSILPYLKKGSISGNGAPRMIDIGTGAGFPGIPVKIVSENVSVTLFDSLEKRVRFLNEVIDDLGLAGIEAVHGRAEDFGVRKDFREVFDIAAARAVANLPVLLEYCLPFVTMGGIFIAMKGSSTDEIKASERALKVLGGEIESLNEILLPGTDIKRNIIIIRKLRQTPTNYPRKAGKPSKDPLL